LVPANFIQPGTVNTLALKQPGATAQQAYTGFPAGIMSQQPSALSLYIQQMQAEAAHSEMARQQPLTASGLTPSQLTFGVEMVLVDKMREKEEKLKREAADTRMREVQAAVAEVLKTHAEQLKGVVMDSSPMKKCIELAEELKRTKFKLMQAGRKRQKVVAEEENSEEEEEEEEEEGEIKDKPKKENADKQSVFRFPNAGEQTTNPAMRMNMMLSVWGVTSAEYFKLWTEKHLKEQTARAVTVLRDIAEAQGVDVKGVKKQGTIIKRIAASYELDP
jgi:hypothetical protein